MTLSRVALLVVTIAMATLAARVAQAGEHTVVIHHMELNQIEGDMKVGDRVVFDNQSDMAHNLYITYADGTIDNLDTQFPGMQRTVTLRLAGPAVVRCWIHPIIKAEMEVLESADPSDKR